MGALISIVILGMFTMFLGIMEKKRLILPVIIIGLIISFGINLTEWNGNSHYFNEMMIVDNFAVAFIGVLIFTSIMVFMFSGNYYHQVERPLEDIYSLMLFALSGAVVMTSFSNLVMLFLVIEILSISMYIAFVLSSMDFS